MVDIFSGKTPHIVKNVAVFYRKLSRPIESKDFTANGCNTVKFLKSLKSRVQVWIQSQLRTGWMIQNPVYRPLFMDLKLKAQHSMITGFTQRSWHRLRLPSTSSHKTRITWFMASNLLFTQKCGTVKRSHKHGQCHFIPWIRDPTPNWREFQGRRITRTPPQSSV